MSNIKVIVQINGVDTEIELTDEQVASIKAKDKFKFVYDKDSSCYLTTTGIADSSNGADPILLHHGRYRKTKEVAEQSFARNKRANRLEAIAEQLGGLREFDNNTLLFYIYKQHDRWRVNSVTTMFFPEVVYMTQECAQTITDMLNNGRFEL
jgi:hypothetical protein